MLTQLAGCVGLKNSTPRFEATAITKLRESGAVLLGKTSLTEWANYRSPGNAPNGWSGVAGQGYGIYIEEQDPGGSSSGSAVAVALGLCPAALGTEVRKPSCPEDLTNTDPEKTSGSIASPARNNGVVGLKPTAGLVSRFGVYSVTEWQDSVGVFAKTVKDAALVLTATAGWQCYLKLMNQLTKN